MKLRPPGTEAAKNELKPQKWNESRQGNLQKRSNAVGPIIEATEKKIRPQKITTDLIGVNLLPNKRKNFLFNRF